MSRKTTLTKIAEAAGVSLSTVDRVLNRRGGVSSAAEEKVLGWAGRLNIDRVVFREHLKVLRVAVVMQTPRNPFYKGLQELVRRPEQGDAGPSGKLLHTLY